MPQHILICLHLMCFIFRNYCSLKWPLKNLIRIFCCLTVLACLQGLEKCISWSLVIDHHLLYRSKVFFSHFNTSKYSCNEKLLGSETIQLFFTQHSTKSGTSAGGQTMQRIILPAAPTSLPVQAVNCVTTSTPTLAPIRPNLQVATPNLTQLPPGTTLLTPSTNIQGLQGFALVPAQYVTQVL